MNEPKRTSWFEDPKLDLDALSPGQRYTLVITCLLAFCLLAFGLPPGGGGDTSSLAAAVGTQSIQEPSSSTSTTLPTVPLADLVVPSTDLPATSVDLSMPVPEYLTGPTTTTSAPEAPTTTTTTTTTTEPPPTGTLPTLPVPLP